MNKSGCGVMNPGLEFVDLNTSYCKELDLGWEGRCGGDGFVVVGVVGMVVVFVVVGVRLRQS